MCRFSQWGLPFHLKEDKQCVCLSKEGQAAKLHLGGSELALGGKLRVTFSFVPL